MFLFFLTSYCQSLPITADHCRALPPIANNCRSLPRPTITTRCGNLHCRSAIPYVSRACCTRFCYHLHCLDDKTVRAESSLLVSPPEWYSTRTVLALRFLLIHQWLSYRKRPTLPHDRDVLLSRDSPGNYQAIAPTKVGLSAANHDSSANSRTQA